MQVIGSIATMPSRSESFSLALQSILPQVNRLYVFLDGFDSIPLILAGEVKCVATLLPNDRNLHSSSRFLAAGLHGADAIVALFDDDIVYPPDYVSRVRLGLDQHGRHAIVGFHAGIFVPPHRSYLRNRSILGGGERLVEDVFVHQLGCGTAAFLSSVFHPNPATWRYNHIDDLYVAAEAVKARLNLVSLRREAGWLRFLAQNQEDSLWRRAQQDDRLHSSFMRDILSHIAQPSGHDWWQPA